MTDADDVLAHVVKAEGHLEVARMLGENQKFPHAVFYLLSAAEEQARATLALAERDRYLTRDPLRAATIPYLTPKVDYSHQTKIVVGITTAVTQRFWAKLAEQRDGGVGWTDKDTTKAENVFRLFDDPSGLREAVNYVGKRRTGKPLPLPPGEEHYRALFPYLEDRADFLRYDLGHPLSEEDKEHTRVNAMKVVHRMQAALKRSGFYKNLKKNE